MADTVRHAYGSKVKYDNDGAGTGLVAVGGVKMFTPWADVRNPVNGTHLESTDGYTEVVPEQGMQTTEVATVTCRFTAARYVAIQTLKFAGSEKYWYFQSPLMSGETTPTQQKGRGLVSKITPPEADVDNDEALMFSFEVTRTVAKPLVSAGA